MYKKVFFIVRAISHTFKYKIHNMFTKVLFNLLNVPRIFLLRIGINLLTVLDQSRPSII